MVICYFNIERIAAAPLETDSPSIIDSDAVLTNAVAAKFFKSIRRRDSQVI